MNKCHIHIKQNSKPSIHFKNSSHLSLELSNKQTIKIFALRCKQPLEKQKSSSINQIIKIGVKQLDFQNKQSNKHVRYLSQQTQQVETYSQLDFDLISERSDDPEQSQRNNHTQNKSQNLDIAKIENQQSELKQSAYFNSQNSLDQLKFNEEFLDLFNKQKGLSQFGQLCIICQNKVKEQEMLIQKIIESRSSKPHPDLHIFLSLMKKPQIEVHQHAKITHQNQQPVFLILVIFFISLISLYIIV